MSQININVKGNFREFLSNPGHHNVKESHSNVGQFILGANIKKSTRILTVKDSYSAG